MALFHKPTCENLRKKNKTMARIDNQTDDDIDSMLIYKPKKMKDASIETLFNTTSTEKGFNHNTKLIVFGVIGAIVWIGLIVVVFTFVL